MKLKARGETIVEVMIAFVILATVLTSVLVVFNQTLSLQSSVRNRVVALYLAQEGLEGIRQIRDTNWLAFSGDKRNRWADGLDTDEFYELSYDLDENRYVVTPSSIQDLLLFTKENFESNPSNYTPFQLYESTTNDEGLFTLSPQDRSGNDNTLTPFFRQIQIEVKNPYDQLVDEGVLANLPTFCDIDDTTCHRAKLMVTSRVGWIEGSSMQYVVLENHLFDYLQRTQY